MIPTQAKTSEKNEKDLSNVIKIDQDQIKSHLGEMVRQNVEQTLNELLDAEADRLCHADRYERTEARTDTRAGHYCRRLQTQAVNIGPQRRILRIGLHQHLIILIIVEPHIICHV